MTITIPELWLGACLGSLATLALVAGLVYAAGRHSQRAARRRAGRGR